MALTTAERQHRHRARKRKQGLKQISFRVSQAEEDLLKMCYDAIGDRPESFEAFLRSMLIKGAVFGTNSGGDVKIKKVDDRYTVTKRDGNPVDEA